MIAGCAGIDMQQVEFAVGHHFQDMAVAAHEKFCPAVDQSACYPWAVSPRVTAYMCQINRHPLYGKRL